MRPHDIAQVTNQSKQMHAIQLPLRARGIAITPYLGYVLIAALTLLMFGEVFLQGTTSVLGDSSKDSSTDMFHEFLALRYFGFKELAQGHVALWNPHVFSGAPFFGGFQSALLYPPNWIFLVLPLAIAVNASIALHVFLMGAFMNAWALRRGLHPLAAALCGVLMMFGGPFFLQIYAGHLTNLCAMVWAPMVFMAIDALTPLPGAASASRYHRRKWILIGAGAVCMQLLAGHPQYAYYCAVSAALYSGFRIAQQTHKAPAMLSLLGFALAGALMAAVQLLTGWQATAETIRGVPLKMEFASRFSLTPESLLTGVAPWMFGKLSHTQYFGRWYAWEMSLYMGVTGCILALTGIWQAFGGGMKKSPESRAPFVLLAMVLLPLLLALGSYTPVFDLLFNYAPGFNRFRGTAKFGFFACIFGALLAAMGYDHMLKCRRASVISIAAAFALAGLSLGALLLSSRVDWMAFVQTMFDTGQTYLPSDLFSNPDAAVRRMATAGFAHDMVTLSLFKVTLTALLLGVVLVFSRKRPVAVWLVGGLVVAEMFVFASQTKEFVELADTRVQRIEQYLSAHPGDFRIANASNPNAAMLIGAADIHGNDATALARYAEFMAYSQGQSPDHATQYLNQVQVNPAFGLLRLRYMFHFFGDGSMTVEEAANPLPHVALVDSYQLILERDKILKAIAEKDFDPHRQVILESEPNPKPAPGATGNVRILSETSDTLEIEADVSQPTLMLVSDLYSRYWRAVALPGSVQGEYTVQPADYVIRAIALQKGHHKLLMEYLPTAWIPGLWISGLAWLAWILCAVCLLWHSFRHSRAD